MASKVNCHRFVPVNVCGARRFRERAMPAPKRHRLNNALLQMNNPVEHNVRPQCSLRARMERKKSHQTRDTVTKWPLKPITFLNSWHVGLSPLQDWRLETPGLKTCESVRRKKRNPIPGYFIGRIDIQTKQTLQTVLASLSDVRCMGFRFFFLNVPHHFLRSFFIGYLRLTFLDCSTALLELIRAVPIWSKILNKGGMPLTSKQCTLWDNRYGVPATFTNRVFPNTEHQSDQSFFPQSVKHNVVVWILKNASPLILENSW